MKNTQYIKQGSLSMFRPGASYNLNQPLTTGVSLARQDKGQLFFICGVFHTCSFHSLIASACHSQ